MAELLPLLQLEADVGPVVDLGVSDGRRRRLVPILGGTVRGAHEGTILAGGADWQELRSDGLMEISARYVLSLREGLVEVESRGVRHAPPEVLAQLDRGETVSRDAYYFRTALRFTTSSEPLSYLNHMLAISIGERLARQVRLEVLKLT